MPRQSWTAGRGPAVRAGVEEVQRGPPDTEVGLVDRRVTAALGRLMVGPRSTRNSRRNSSRTMKALEKFIEVSNQHTPYLLRKAQRARGIF